MIGPKQIALPSGCAAAAPTAFLVRAPDGKLWPASVFFSMQVDAEAVFSSEPVETPPIWGEIQPLATQAAPYPSSPSDPSPGPV